jgi:MFS family permease
VGDGFAGFLSIFNMGGRFFWSSTSDYTGRKNVYFLYFLAGAALYSLVPLTQQIQNVALFVLVTALIISMYGGGFSTIPAYLRDIFGTMQVGAIHGRLITAWSMAAVLGPQLITYIAEYQKSHQVPVAQSYNVTMYLMAGLLVLGALCNFLVRPVHPRHHYTPPDAQPDLAKPAAAAR